MSVFLHYLVQNKDPRYLVSRVMLRGINLYACSIVVFLSGCSKLSELLQR